MCAQSRSTLTLKQEALSGGLVPIPNPSCLFAVSTSRHAGHDIPHRRRRYRLPEPPLLIAQSILRLRQIVKLLRHLLLDLILWVKSFRNLCTLCIKILSRTVIEAPSGDGKHLRNESNEYVSTPLSKAFKEPIYQDAFPTMLVLSKQLNRPTCEKPKTSPGSI